VDVLKLSQALQEPLTELVATFPLGGENSADGIKDGVRRFKTKVPTVTGWNNSDKHWQEFQQLSLQVLESWLPQWPTAAYKARKIPSFQL